MRARRFIKAVNAILGATMMVCGAAVHDPTLSGLGALVLAFSLGYLMQEDA